MPLELTADEQESIFKLASRITGTCQSGKYRRHSLIANVQRRISAQKATNFPDYLKLALADEEEYAHFVSALTIHTTSWFRELNQLNRLREFMLKNATKFAGRTVRILSAACSTGEEVYSLAILMEDCRARIPGFDYRVFGYDIDPRCVKVAKEAVYSLKTMTQIPPIHLRHFWVGSGSLSGKVQVEPEIRAKCAFKVGSLLDAEIHPREMFDIVFCRNALIYFDDGGIRTILDNLGQSLTRTGVLCVGQSEHVTLSKFGMNSHGNAIFVRGFEDVSPKVHDESKPKGKRLLVVEDSPTVRAVLTQVFSKSGFEVEAAASAQAGTDALQRGKFDIISLDLNLPDEHGATWLYRHRQGGLKTPVVVISETSEKEAVQVLGVLEKGAQDFVTKGMLAKPDELTQRFHRIADAFASRPDKAGPSLLKTRGIGDFASPEVLLVGASTGGPQALCQLLRNMPRGCPPVVIVQHIPDNFSLALLERLSQVSGLGIGVATSGSPLLPGHLYMATGDYHVGLARRSGKLCLSQSNAAPVMSHRPSVDHLFLSAAELRVHALAVLLTGMGSDGARGMAALAQIGALNLVQDETSSVIFGMPREAIKLGAASYVAPVHDLRAVIDRVLIRPARAAA